ncbi:hypothetical protein [Vibrio sp. Vb339]|uniref:hypothetical protein n=1 Tax=Vibrio sp. Vb339 TaxID=1192013 RepID=UPI0015516D54|nr:hypothetical protein [Vibrio sp. Vb339]
MKSRISNIVNFHDKFFIYSVLMMLVHQMLIGSSVIFIYLASKYSDINSDKSVIYFYLFLFCMISPYFFGTVANYLSSIWSLNCIKKFITEKSHIYDSSSAMNEGSTLFRDGVIAYSKTSSEVIRNICEYFSNLISSSLNSLISIVAVSYIVSGNMIFAFFVSGLFIYLFIYLFYKKYKISSKNELVSLNELSSELLTVGNNLVLGGKINRNIWTAMVNEKLESYSNKYIANERINSTGNFLIGISSVIPISVYLTYISYNSSDLSTIDYVSILVVSTRIFHICNSTYDLFSLFYKKSSINGQAEGLSHTLNVCSNKGQSHSINWPENIDVEKIFLGGEKVSAFTPNEFLAKVLSNGLHTITGENGAGKSTILKWVKSESVKYKDSYFISPEKKALWGNSKHSSSGEYVSHALRSLYESENDGVMLLLDEWDANLDSANKLTCRNYIESMSNDFPIVEVLHRKVST